MAVVNPSIITDLTFTKQGVQNVLQALAFAINGRAAVNQVVERRIALAGGTGPNDVIGTVAYYPSTNAPAVPADYDYFAPPLVAANGGKVSVGAAGATRLPTTLTGSSVTLSMGWSPAVAGGGNIWRGVSVVRHRVGAVPAVVGTLGPGTRAMPLSGGVLPESIVLSVGSDVFADDYLYAVAYRDSSNAGDTFPSGVTIVALDLIYKESVTLTS